MIRKVLPFLALACAAAFVPQEADASGAATRTRSNEPAPMSPVVPGVVVLTAIGATVIRMNRRG